MSIKSLLIDVALTTSATFVTAAVVTYLYSLIVHGAGVVNWETACQLALIFGLVLPLTRGSEHEQSGELESRKS